MHPAPLIAASPPSRLARRLVLGSAVLLALAIAAVPRFPGVHAQDARPASPPAPPAAPTAPAKGNPSLTVTDGEGGSATVDIHVDKGKRTVTIEKSATEKPSRWRSPTASV